MSLKAQAFLNVRCLGGTEVEEGVRPLCVSEGRGGGGGEKRHQEQPGAEGESLWSGFTDAEDKGISRKRELSASELLQKGPEVDETWKLGDVAGHGSVGGKMVVNFLSV